MLSIINQENNGVIVNMIVKPKKCNIPWGIEYMLMDSDTFMGSIDSEGYENIINIFCGIWNNHEYNVLI